MENENCRMEEVPINRDIVRERGENFAELVEIVYLCGNFMESVQEIKEVEYRAIRRKKGSMLALFEESWLREGALRWRLLWLLLLLPSALVRAEGGSNRLSEGQSKGQEMLAVGQKVSVDGLAEGLSREQLERRAQAQEGQVVKVVLTDSATGEGIADVAVLVLETNQSRVSDRQGTAVFTLPAGYYTLDITHLAYGEVIRPIQVKSSEEVVRIALAQQVQAIREVVVTASESTGAQTSSLIGKEAMQHLQPSSFADLVGMLPGAQTSAPNLTSANTIRLREASNGTGSDDYAAASLGTSFVIDGAPLSTDANMQYVQSSSTQDDQRQVVNKGVDMRTISTDDIEKVEIIRGIAGAEYGDVTSGVVKIERTMKPTPWRARFKADGFSKLLYFGKGWEFGRSPSKTPPTPSRAPHCAVLAGTPLQRGLSAKGGNNGNSTVLNIGLDYLNAKNDPTNTLENYQRITGSVRLQNRWQVGDTRVRWQTNLDYTGSIDNDKIDPDINHNKEDSYRSEYHHLTWGNTLNINNKTQSWWAFALTTNLSYSLDRIRQTKFTQLTTPIQPALTSLVEGAQDMALLPYQYVAGYTVDGKPLNVFVRPKANFVFHTWMIDHKAAVGVEWKYDKNFGRGQVYDLARPLNYASSLRPRAYNDIPATNQLAWYIQDEIHIPAGKTSFDLEVGLRGTSLLGLDGQYTMHGKCYLDPRVNLMYNIPVPGGKVFLAAAVGRHTKMPTLLQLYPNQIYEDLKVRNVTVSEDSVLNVYTHIIDPTNYKLTPARNLKWEVRAGFEIHKHAFSVTYFQERMQDGFRQWRNCLPFTYTVDSIATDGTRTPLTYSKLLTYTMTTNGSEIRKEGVEWQYRSPRIPAICTRFTVNGAWLRTTYKNSQAVFSTDKLNEVINGVAVKDYYIGYYDWEDGSVRENLNTNVIADVYIERIGLTVSATVEMTLYSAQRTLRKNGVPVAYMDLSGELKPYTETEQNDPVLQALIFSYNEDQFRRKVVPFAGYLNLRVQKSITRYADIAFFVNKLLDYLPDYKVDGVTIHRSASPYFGMEVNLKL